MTEIVYNAEPTLAKFHASNAFIRGIKGPVGSGKSVGMCTEIIRRAMEQRAGADGKRHSRWGVVRNTYIELKMTTIRTWLDWVPDSCNKMKWDAPITSHVVFTLPDGTTVDLEVMFVSLDRPEDIKKLKSFDATGIWINEAVEEPKAVLDIATSRVGRYPSERDGGCTYSGIIMDTNPCDTDHWWYYLAEKDLTTERGRKAWEEITAAEQVMRQAGLLAEGQPLMEFFSQPPALIFRDGLWVPNANAENVSHLNGGFAYYLRQVAGKSHEWINTYLGGHYGKVVDGKPVYTEYADNIHAPGISLYPQEGLPIIIGLDYGLTPAAAICQATSRGQFNVLGELCSDGMGIERFLRDALKPYLAANFSGFRFKVYGDPAGSQRTQGDEKTCRMYVEAAGFDYESAASNSPIARREAVAYFLNRMVDGKPGLQIDLSCQMIRKGFAGGYHYKRVPVIGEERFKDEPDKNIYSHIHDALQYAAMSVGSVQAVQQNTRTRSKWEQGLRTSFRPGGFMGR